MQTSKLLHFRLNSEGNSKNTSSIIWKSFGRMAEGAAQSWLQGWPANALPSIFSWWLTLIMDLYRQLYGLKQHIPPGQSAGNLLPCLHPTFPFLLWEEEASALTMAFSLHSQQTALEVWSGGGTCLRRFHVPLVAPFLLLVVGASSWLRSGIPTSKGRRHFPGSLCLVSPLE